MITQKKYKVVVFVDESYITETEATAENIDVVMDDALSNTTKYIGENKINHKIKVELISITENESKEG